MAARLAEDPNVRIVIDAGGNYTANPNATTPAKYHRCLDDRLVLGAYVTSESAITQFGRGGMV